MLWLLTLRPELFPVSLMVDLTLGITVSGEPCTQRWRWRLHPAPSHPTPGDANLLGGDGDQA